MSKTIIILAISILSFSASSQVYVNGININDTDTQYCSFEGGNGKVSLDYGQHNIFLANDRLITDSSGKPLRFNSKIDVMNHLEKNGWQLLEIVSDTSRASFYFKKR